MSVKNEENVVSVSGKYETWFLDYASYVILERAIPTIEDGLKPVQRRILHAMKELDDGRFNKVANLIGTTMQYHPHGDASISDAMVHLAQKELLIETQGNWGDIRTGDSAAASRYIEARLSNFALEVLFNPKTTKWQLSYDGRKREPVTFPVKFPLLIAHGVEGIAVGLSTKILPHNFCEVVQASISELRRKKYTLYPDFLTYGRMDSTNYLDGQKGGKIRVRSTIKEYDSKTLVIKDVPYGVTTGSLIESIIKANEKGKIKIKKVVDNTAKDIEIFVSLASGISPDVTMDALYAFTDCEVSISPNACVVISDKPHFVSVTDILKYSVQKTLAYLKEELKILRGELLEKILFNSLEKIFIENRIYRKIEECETWEDVLKKIDEGLKPFRAEFYREITREDITKLTEIKIKRISRYDGFKTDEITKKYENELNDTQSKLDNLVDYAIDYYKNILKKYGKGRERKTEIVRFDTIAANIVAAKNVKLYVDKKGGFIGHGLKKNEYICDCSDIDDIIVFTKNGRFMVTKIQEKKFVAKDIIHAQVFNKNDERLVYHLIYLETKSGKTYLKRFQIHAITRDKKYYLTKNAGGRVLYFSNNPNGESEVVKIQLTQGCLARNKVFECDFATVGIKGRVAGGNVLTKYPVRKITLKNKGASVFGGLEIWYDTNVGNLNREGRGDKLGFFFDEERVIVFYKNGTYETTDYELTNHYDYTEVLKIYKHNINDVYNMIYFDGGSKNFFLKRFKIETQTLKKRFLLTTDHKRSRLLYVKNSLDSNVEILYKKGSKVEKETMEINSFEEVKGWKAQGKKLPYDKIIDINASEKMGENKREAKNGDKSSGQKKLDLPFSDN